AELIDALRDKTVAMVSYDNEFAVHVHCAGVWVGPSMILTAAHCVDAEQAMVGESGFGFASYKDLGSEGDQGQPVDAPRIAWLLERDTKRDLALLMSALPTPPHPIAMLSPARLTPGMHVHIVGHTVGLAYSYSPGVVSGVRNMTGPGDVAGKIVQVWAGA